MLEYGDGIKPDLVKARVWYLKAAAQNYKDAQVRVKKVEEKIQASQIPSTLKKPTC